MTQPRHEPEFSDAANRCSDQVRLHIVAGNAGKWAAIKLADGSSDGIAYDERADAIEHQLHESLCCYVKIPYDDMPPREAEAFMAVNRKLYDAGFRLTDPDDERMPIMPYRMEEVAALIGRDPRYRA